MKDFLRSQAVTYMYNTPKLIIAQIQYTRDTVTTNH